jgi:CubicO group peptidase (beta-lactamase class C family)
MKEVRYMAYSRGSSSNIIVGAAALFTHDAGPIGLDEDGKITDAQAATDLPPLTASATSYKTTLSADNAYTNIGYTSNGLELAFEPDFGEVAVDQLLDVARLFKQGMTVNLNTSFAEATLENLLVAIAADEDDLSPEALGLQTMNMSAGDIGDVPLERGLVAVGPGSGSAADPKERIYVAYRALSIESVTVSAKRDEASMFEVSFRLLPNDDASYGKIVDRSLA